ncbi:MAG TPA: SDR family oxidoreductase [Thermoleophilaceae bacterium]|nr:SDR family oxidoreductase [Thermoleophilaceae bacterium]
MTDAFSQMRLDGKVVVVTGSTQGLGAAIARRAAQLGATGLVVTGRDAERGEAVRGELEDGGTPAHFVQADLADPDDCAAIVADCDARFGRLDGLVNAAGLSTRGTIDDTSVELWDLLFAVNVRAPFLLIQHGARLMRRAGDGGSVVNIITMASHGGEPVLTAYASSKGALATLTRNAGYSLQPDRIRVNGLNIGWTATDGENMVQASVGQPRNWLEEADANAALGRLLRPDDITPMVTYLLSDAAQMVTGSVIDFDQTVHGPDGEHLRETPSEATA